jgi:acylphosphatase
MQELEPQDRFFCFCTPTSPCSALWFPSMTSTERATQARRFVVRGRVQGVGFRWFVEREAHLLGLFGWVRNNADGSVEVLAQGTRDQLLGLRSRLRQGPRAARVDDVEESEVGPVAGLSSFRIEGAW